MIVRNGWTLLFHDCLAKQLSKLEAAAQRAKQKDPENYQANANVRLFNALSQRILKTVPDDPNREQYRIGTTMGSNYSHWRRIKIGRRFRLFFRFDSASRIILYAWVNDEDTLRSAGSKNDPYSVFRKMLDRNNPPDSWNDLLKSCETNANINEL